VKTILKRVDSLENKLGPQADLASLHLAAMLTLREVIGCRRMSGSSIAGRGKN
jgi:hypothetical protein